MKYIRAKQTLHSKREPGERMKDYYALTLNNDIVFFDSVEKLLQMLEQQDIPAKKCSFQKVLNVGNLERAQNYLETHSTIPLSYEDLKRELGTTLH